MRVLIIFLILQCLWAPSLRAQDDALYENTWHLRYLQIDGERTYAPTSIPFTLNISNTNGTNQANANGVENALSAVVNFTNTGVLTFDEIAATLLDCTVVFCDYEDSYFYDFLTTVNLESKTFEYTVNTYNQSPSSLLLVDQENNRAYFTSAPLQMPPELFQTWYVYQQNVDFEDPQTFVPNVSKSVTINEDLSFTGLDDCTSYSGNLIYGEDFVNGFVLIGNNFELLSEDCPNGNPAYNYFYIGQSGYEDICSLYESQNDMTLAVNDGLGFGTFYTNQLLSTEEFARDQINIFPNPAQNIVNVQVSNELVLNLSLLDALGKELLSDTQNPSLNISSIAAGMYFLKVKTTTQEHTFKIIKR